MVLVFFLSIIHLKTAQITWNFHTVLKWIKYESGENFKWFWKRQRRIYEELYGIWIPPNANFSFKHTIFLVKFWKTSTNLKKKVHPPFLNTPLSFTRSALTQSIRLLSGSLLIFGRRKCCKYLLIIQVRPTAIHQAHHIQTQSVRCLTSSMHTVFDWIPGQFSNILKY